MLRYADFRIDASSVKDLPDGGIRVTAQLTHAGIFNYRNHDGSMRREYRPPEEVFSKESLESFAGAVVTISHPRLPNGSRLVDSKSWRGVAVGHVGDSIRQDGENAVAELYIRDASAVERIKKRDLQHVSLGYKLDFDPTPGVTKTGERYDGVQRNIRGNHVALLPNSEAPRGGAQCTLRLDSNGDELKSDVDLEQALAKIAALEGELSRARTDAADLPNTRKALADAQADIARLSEQLSPARLDSLVESRALVVMLAKSEGIDPAGKSALQVKRAIVAKRTPALAARVDSMGDDALDGIMAVYQAQPAAPSAPHNKIAEVLAPPAAPAGGARADSAGVRTDGIPKVADIHGKFITESRNAWKNSGDKVN